MSSASSTRSDLLRRHQLRRGASIRCVGLGAPFTEKQIQLSDDGECNMLTVLSAIERLKRPEHTGPNRCLSCTLVNLLVALSVSAIVSVLSSWLALAMLLLSVGAIYLRGYLVPGTPTLTRRYLPPRLLRAFGKRPSETGPPVVATDPLDPERVLRATGVLTDCTTGDDVCLEERFKRAWDDHIRGIHHSEAAQRDTLGALFGAGRDAVTIEEYETTAPLILDSDDPVRTVVAAVDGERVGMWDSRAAFVADITAATELESRYSDWFDLGDDVRSTVLVTLRAFLDTCPMCDGDVVVSVDDGDACCGGSRVVQATCADCEDLLFEVSQDHGPVTS